MRNIGEIDLPEPLVIAIQQAGNRKLILVEGETDQEVFENCYKKYLSSLYFYECGGEVHVAKYLKMLDKISRSKRFFGILDKDFKDNEIITTSRSDNSRLFILKWYCIENYLLDTELVFDELCLKNKKSDRSKIGLSSVNDITKYIDKLKVSLSKLTAADWLIAEVNRLKNSETEADEKTERVAYFSLGFDADKHDDIIKALVQKIGTSDDDVKIKLAQKENILESCQEIHTHYNGKRIIHQICKRFQFTDESHFKKLLISRLPSLENHAHFKEIFEDRILKTY